MKTMGGVCENVVLVQFGHERTDGIGQDWVFGRTVSAVLLHSQAVAIGSVLCWMLHLQCRVLITHGAVVKVQMGPDVHNRKTSTGLS